MENTMKKIFIAGIDGYLGWPLAMKLAMKGHEIVGVDNETRRKLVAEVGSTSAIPICNMNKRVSMFEEQTGKEITFFGIDLREYSEVSILLQEYEPDVIVHLGEIPSAPFSMMNIDNASYTQTNNILSTLNLAFAMRDHVPHAHMLKLGTMGEYGVPNIDIPEGYFEIEYRGRRDRLPFPKQAASFYHLSKVHDTHNLEFASKVWGLTVTDIMQGPVFGCQTPEISLHPELATRFDFDGIWGTVVNRYVAEAVIGMPLSPYGTGGQQRGFLTLQDSLDCMELVIEKPPKRGEFRVINQFAEWLSVIELAHMVGEAGDTVGIKVDTKNIPNPRIESEEHYFNPDLKTLLQMGYTPTPVKDALPAFMKSIYEFKDRILQYSHVIEPKVLWNPRK